MPFEKEKLQFGGNSFVGPALNDPEFYELPIRDQAKALGWAAGCPVTNELTDPEIGRGPEAMLKRYAEVAFWGGFINRAAKEINPNLYDQLTQSVSRRDDEPIGKYEPESIPESYLTEIPPSETLVGYSMPRLLTKELGDKSLLPVERQDKLFGRLSIIEQSIRDSSTPEELLALSSEAMIKTDLDPITVLSTVLSTGWYGEHNADSMVDTFKTALELKAPLLWGIYDSLSEQEKAENKIL